MLVFGMPIALIAVVLLYCLHKRGKLGGASRSQRLSTHAVEPTRPSTELPGLEHEASLPGVASPARRPPVGHYVLNCQHQALSKKEVPREFSPEGGIVHLEEDSGAHDSQDSVLKVERI